ncbi:MAG: hypothetical protein WBV69_20850 [Candidatus Sulfotelmatobacter sp.]
MPNTKEAILGGTRPNLRILLWSGTDVTFMQLDGAANLAITGPLTGFCEYGPGHTYDGQSFV